MRHSSKRRKLSSGSYQEIYQDLIDGRSVSLDDFDIEDSDRKLPPRFFDIDGTYINGYRISEIFAE
jgi:hypothetical protein